MKVTKLNFKYLYPKISKILKDCDYIAIDMEFSGTASKKELTNTKYDDLSLRYFKLKESTKNYLPLQFGLCGMKIKKDSQIQLYPINFFIFPYVNESTSRKYTFDIGSINFLSHNMFDFNKTFYDGVRYVSLSEFERNKFQKISNEEKNAKNKNKIFPPEAKLFTISIYNSLKKFVENFVKNNIDYNSKENIFQFEINSIRKIMLEYFMANVNNLFQVNGKNIIFDVEIDETNITKTFLKLKIANETLLQEKLFFLENEKNFKKIASWIYYQSLAMIESDEEANKVLWKRILTNLVYKNMKSENSELNNVMEKYLNEEFEDKTNLEKENYLNEIKKILSNNTAKINFTSPFYKELSKFILSLDNVDEFYKVGFSKVISDLIKNKKNLIFHNGILDLIHLIDKFIQPVPETFDEFVTTVNKYFPSVYDTKYIIENNSSLFSIFPQSSLETVYNKINSNISTDGEGDRISNYELDVVIDEEIVGKDYQLFKKKNSMKKSYTNTHSNDHNTNYSSQFLQDDPVYIMDESMPIPNSLSTRHIMSDEVNDEDNSDHNCDVVDSNETNGILSLRAHEAGYDAMLTCYVFVFVYKFLSNHKNPFYDKNSLMLLEIFKNKMLFSGLQFSCDLNKKNLQTTNQVSSPRFEIFVLLDLPEIITADELKLNFKNSFGMTPMIYKLFGQNVAYAIFTKTKEREEFLKLKKEGEDNLILAKLYLQEYKKDSLIVSYSKYVSNIKSEMDIEKILKELE